MEQEIFQTKASNVFAFDLLNGGSRCTEHQFDPIHQTFFCEVDPGLDLFELDLLGQDSIVVQINTVFHSAVLNADASAILMHYQDQLYR